MKCQHCGHESESGKFCSNCGTLLDASFEDQETIDPNAIVLEQKAEIDSQPENVNDQKEAGESQEPLPIPSTSNTESAKDQEKQTENKADFTDQFASVFTNFGHFFLTLVKKPSEARKANEKDIFSALITILAFSLIVALTLFLPHAFIARRTWFIPGPSVFYEFIMPLFLFIILLGGVASLTYVAAKITKVEHTYLDVIGKFGAYLLPYVLLYLVGALLSIGHMPFLPAILFSISIFGPIFVIPVCILFEKEATGLDRIYTLLGQYFVTFLFIYLIANSLVGGIMRDMLYYLR
jgi:hypothetical protein